MSNHNSDFDPYSVLGLERSASEGEIRARYLQLVKQYPPERAPDRFQEIRRAYAALSDKVAMWERRLFEPVTSGSVVEIIQEHRADLRGRRIPVDLLLSLGDLQ